MADHEPFRFVVDSALLGELGEKLVTTVHVALSELVKNAYDADATKVKVSILPEAGAPRTVVKDDGIGMNPEEVKLFWMKIGTANKAAEPFSKKYGRLKTGSKGIGRFASRRLGLLLRLTTTALVRSSTSHSKGYQTTRVDFDWSDFAAGVDVEEVECLGQTTFESSGESGTTLEIWGGKTDEWQTRGFNYLQRQLAILASNRGIARPGYKEDPGFNVILEAPGLSGQPIDIRDAIIDASWGTLRAEVRPDGRAVCTLNAKGLGGTKKFTSSDQFGNIVGASLVVGILPSKRDEARKPNILADYVLSDIIEEWGGIHVRFNGFRVYPYGDSGDDWLRIDADRGRRMGRPEGELFDFAASLDRVDATRSLLNMLGMRNYLGHVEATSQIAELTPRIDRQGFLDTPAFEELRRFARFAIDWANINRDHYIRLREHEQTEQARQRIRPVLDLDGPKEEIVPKATSFLRKEFKRLVERLPEKQRKETEQTLGRTLHAIDAVTTESRKQLEHLRLVASASTLTLLFAHEVRTVIGTLGAASLRLEQISQAIPSQAKALKALSGQLRETKKRFDNLLGMTGIVSAFRETASLAEIHLRGAVERAARCFEQVIVDYEITVDDSDVPPDITLGPMIEGELYTILLNLFSNAFKSLVASGGSHKTIRVEAVRTTAKKVTIRIMDNGLGLDEEFYEEVFTPFIADPSGALYDKLQERANPEDSTLLGTGSGLGLAIARDVARSRSGDVKFIIPPVPWKACVEVELP